MNVFFEATIFGEILLISGMPLVGGQGRFSPTRNSEVQLILLQPRGQIMPTALLLAHPGLKT